MGCAPKFWRFERKFATPEKIIESRRLSPQVQGCLFQTTKMGRSHTKIIGRNRSKIGQKIGNYFKNIKIIKILNKKLYSACFPLVLTK